MDGREVVNDIRRVSAAYRDRYQEWPREVRMDGAQLSALTAGCTADGLRMLIAHVRVAGRDGVGVSAGGRGVVELDVADPTPSALEAAGLWLHAVKFVPVSTISVKSGFWLDLAQASLARLPELHEFGLADLLLSFSMSPERLESMESSEEWSHELLFQFAYVSSFGLEGVHPKALHVTWAGHGWRRHDVFELKLALRLDDGRTVTCDPPWDLITGFRATRADLHNAAVRLGQGVAAFVGEMGRAGQPPG